MEQFGTMSSGDRSLLEHRDLSAARLSERNKRSSMLTSKMRELVLKGLVN